MKLTIFILASALLYSCASTMPGHQINTGSQAITATVTEDDVLSDNRIKMLQISLKNETDDWLEFDGALLEEGKNIEVLVGGRITAWIDARMIEKKVSDYNWSLALSTLTLGGAAVAGASQHQRTAETGAIVSLGAVTGLAVMGFQDTKRRVDFQSAFPERHIFRPFIIPPRKVIQRWILLDNKNDETIVLKGLSQNGVSFRLEIQRSKESSRMSQRAI